MNANIKLNIWVPFIIVLVVAFFLMQEFNVLDVVMVIGGLVIVGYFILGFVRRKDALVITDEKMIVKTPFQTKEFLIEEITEIFFKERDVNVLKGTVKGETVTLCGNIYDVPIEDIMGYLFGHFGHIKQKTESK